MRPIRAQLCTGWKGMAEARWIATRWIVAGEGLRPEMGDKRCIPSRDRSRQDMDRDWIWMDDRRWMTGGERQEMDHGRRMTVNLLPFMKILRLYEVIPFSRSVTMITNYEVTIERRYADTRCTGGMAPPSTIPSTTQSTFQRYRIMHLHARVSMPNVIPNEIPTQLR